MIEQLLILLILLPLAAAAVTALLPRRWHTAMGALSIAATAADFGIAIALFGGAGSFQIPWAGFGIDIALRLDTFSHFIALGASFFGLMVSLYGTVFMRGRPHVKQFFLYLLISMGLTLGAVLASNLVFMLFCWEGLLITLFGMIAIGGKTAFRSAIKALVIVGISDLCLMVGIGIVWHLTGTLDMAQIHLPATGAGAVAFLLLMIGAIAKAGAMPFHSWIPDAATEAPLPFMAFMPASLEKLLGISFLARISLDLFTLTPGSWLSPLLMVIGIVTILLAVLMALVQKDYKRLLSYHAISQVGYMVLGIGTALPVGIVGGLFHMINHALYKSCLFLTGGAVERQAGTTDLSRLGGIGRNMPVTFVCFIVAAASISGVPPFNGFFSKELVYDAALERGSLFYAAALLGSFLTAASFLKLGHAAFLGRRSEDLAFVRETPWLMLAPMIAIAALCVLFGVAHGLPVDGLIVPSIVGRVPEAVTVGGLPMQTLLVALSVLVLAAALVNHLLGARISGSGLGAADHIHDAPGLSTVYGWAERRLTDPYVLGRYLIRGAARALWAVDRGVDWLFEGFLGRGGMRLAGSAGQLQSAKFSVYILSALAGLGALIFWMLR